MIDRGLLEELNQKINAVLRNSPAADIERNLRALMGGWFERLDLVAREDFEVQRRLLERAQSRLQDLEARVADLEAKRSGK